MEIYTIKDVQEVLHIGHTTAYKLFQKPGFPGFKLGNKLMIKKTDLEMYLDSYKGSSIEL